MGRLVLATLLLLACVAMGTSAAAQTRGFAIDRFDPSERGSDWFASESLDLRGHVRPAVGLIGDYAFEPLVITDPDGNQIAAVVEHQLFVHAGFGLVFWDRLRLAANLPLAVYQSGEGGTIANTSFDSSSKTTVGDARLTADVRLLGEYGGPAQVAAGLRVYLPTGDRQAFTGDEAVRVAPRLMISGDIAWLAYAAQGAFVFRAQDDPIGGVPTGSEVFFSAALGPRVLDGKLILGPEIYGSTVVEGGGTAFSRRTTPFEIVFSAHYHVTDEWRAGAGVGPGLTAGLGAPKVRALLSVEWAPPYEEKPEPTTEEPSDRDDDGILDDDDACPDDRGVRNDDPDKHGCPPPGDRDADGVLDEDDACPDEPGEQTDDPETNGCPPPDRDGDGVLDRDDACPDTPGKKTDDPETNGCPPPKDTDGDRILDENDACPKVAGKPNDDPKKHGCPAARVEKGQIKILERVEFETASAKIRSESEDVLQAVYEILKDHDEITKVLVEGHTDNRGARRYNQRLSERRAASVVKWLVARGIEDGRLDSAGLGMVRPIDTNDTAEGRQNNRRVEFHIVEKNGKPVKRDR